MYKMEDSTYKNGIKTLFLIINSCIALTMGLYPVSLGMAVAVTGAWEPEPIIGCLILFVVGTLILGLATLGHFGAILEKRTLLTTYSAVVGLVTCIEVVLMVKLMATRHFSLIVFGIFHAVLMPSALLLAMALARKTRKQPDPVVPVNLVAVPTAPTAV